MTSIRSDRGKPKKQWGKVIRHEMMHLEFTEDLTLDMRFGGWGVG